MSGFLTGLAAASLLAITTFLVLGAAQISVVDRTEEGRMIVVRETEGLH